MDVVLSPIKYCGNEFENRSAAIDHFKMLHVMNTIYCPLCCEPCCANFPTDFKQHYQIFHQKHKMPYSFDEGMDDSAAPKTKKITKRTLSAIRAPRTRKKITVVFSFICLIIYVCLIISRILYELYFNFFFRLLRNFAMYAKWLLEIWRDICERCILQRDFFAL